MKRARLTFWGVRGSIAIAGRRTLGYGGNTSCLHVECDGAHLICDAGTGIQPLGNALQKRFSGRPLQACVLLSHLHWDHYFGLPFFKPLYEKRNAFLIAGPGVGRVGFERLLGDAIGPPYFPIRLSVYAASIEYRTVRAEGFEWEGIGIVPVPANHPDGACGWRLFFPNGRSAVVMTDDEFAAGKRRRELVKRVQGADLLIHDAQYTPEKYAQRRGWGHSPFTYPVELARAAGIGKLYLTHFDPDDDDRAIRRMLAAARRHAAAIGGGVRCELAREGLSILL